MLQSKYIKMKKVKISYENFIAMAPSAAEKRTKQENPLRHEKCFNRTEISSSYVMSHKL